MPVLCPQLMMFLFAMRMHIGTRLECSRTIRTCVQIDSRVRCHVLLKANGFLECLIAHCTLVRSFTVNVSHVVAQGVLIRSDLITEFAYFGCVGVS